jgi:hypothetical protein
MAIEESIKLSRSVKKTRFSRLCPTDEHQPEAPAVAAPRVAGCDAAGLLAPSAGRRHDKQAPALSSKLRGKSAFCALSECVASYQKRVFDILSAF